MECEVREVQEVGQDDVEKYVIFEYSPTGIRGPYRHLQVPYIFLKLVL